MSKKERPLIERDYIETLYEMVTLEAWRGIVEGAIDAAQNGDPKAREWLTRLVLSDAPMTLSALAQRRALGVEARHEIAASVDEIERPNDNDILLKSLGAGESRFDRALRIAKQEGNGRK